MTPDSGIFEVLPFFKDLLVGELNVETSFEMTCPGSTSSKDFNVFLDLKGQEYKIVQKYFRLCTFCGFYVHKSAQSEIFLDNLIFLTL